MGAVIVIGLSAFIFLLIIAGEGVVRATDYVFVDWQLGERNRKHYGQAQQPPATKKTNKTSSTPRQPSNR